MDKDKQGDVECELKKEEDKQLRNSFIMNRWNKYHNFNGFY